MSIHTLKSKSNKIPIGKKMIWKIYQTQKATNIKIIFFSKFNLDLRIIRYIIAEHDDVLVGC